MMVSLDNIINDTSINEDLIIGEKVFLNEKISNQILQKSIFGTVV